MSDDPKWNANPAETFIVGNILYTPPNGGRRRLREKDGSEYELVPVLPNDAAPAFLDADACGSYYARFGDQIHPASPIALWVRDLLHARSKEVPPFPFVEGELPPGRGQFSKAEVVVDLLAKAPDDAARCRIVDRSLRLVANAARLAEKRITKDVRESVLDEIARWLRNPEAMANYAGLPECTYTNAVLTEDLAKAIDEGRVGRELQKQKEGAR